MAAVEERALRWSASRGELVESPTSKRRDEELEPDIAGLLHERMKSLEEWSCGEVRKLEATVAALKSENERLAAVEKSFSKARSDKSAMLPPAALADKALDSTENPKKSQSSGTPRSGSNFATESVGDASPRSPQTSPRGTKLAVSFHSDCLPQEVPDREEEVVKDPPDRPPELEVPPIARVRMRSGDWGRVSFRQPATAWDNLTSERRATCVSERSEAETLASGFGSGFESASPYPAEGGMRTTRVNSRHLHMRPIFEIGVDVDAVMNTTSSIAIINVRKGSVATSVSANGLATSPSLGFLNQASWFMPFRDFMSESRFYAFLSGCIVRPSAKRRIAWDLLCFLMVSYDIVMIPLHVFSLPPTSWAKIMAVCTAAFWTADIFFTFVVGYHLGGTTEMRPLKIAEHYMRTFFALDLIVVSLDWVNAYLAYEQGENLMFAMMVPRLLRVMKVARLFRIMKVAALVEQTRFFIHSELLMTFIKVLKFLVSITIINHFVAFAWYGIGKYCRNQGMSTGTWVNELQEKSAQQLDWDYYYTTALHWSLTQFTPASMEVVPCNTLERIFTVIVIIVALILFSSFLSTITQAMTHLRQVREEKWQQQQMVWRYMNENNVSIELANSIHSFISKYSSIVKKRIHQKDIMILRAMPETIRLHLDYEVNVPVLLKHPLFERCVEISETGMMNLCHFAMKEMSLMVGQELFLYTEKAEQMFFLLSGQLKYHYKAGASGASVSKGENICEMALWAYWSHRGNMISSTPSELMVLDGEKLQSVFVQVFSLLRNCQEYVRAYLQMLREAQDTGIHLTDVWKDQKKQIEMAYQAFEKFNNRRGSMSTVASEASHYNFRNQASWESTSGRRRWSFAKKLVFWRKGSSYKRSSSFVG
mmetsp:Transcript_26070/g.57426  ORF Transcript_26070/g.57426 Transcript_26070/m.57426 type:complete len:880 (+) Transcript_26070:138-2777(+)